MSQGSRSTQVINLDDDLRLNQRLAKPQIVTFAGREWNVNRDLDGAKIVEFWELVTKNDGGPALALLVGEEDGPILDAKLQALPASLYVKKLHQFIAIAGLKRGDEPEETTGESTPSSSGS